MSAGSSRLVWRILANDLRLYFRAWQRKGRSLALTILIQAVIVAVLHVQIPIIFRQIAAIGGRAGGAGLACAFVVLFTLMAGFHRSVEVLYNRGDLPYLLSSPVPARVVIVTRLADIVVTTSLTTLFMVMPMLDCAVYLFGKHWLWGWLAWILSVVSLAPAALLATILLVKWLGARVARTVVQLVGIVIGTGAILTMQAPNWLRHINDHPEQLQMLRRYFAAFDVPPLAQLSAAASGEVRWLLALAALAIVGTLLALRALEREFFAGAQAAAGDAGGRPSRSLDTGALAAAWAHAFRASRWTVLVRKELRTLLRDPLLLVRSSTQLISFLPALIGLFWTPRLVALGSFAVVVPALTAISTATLMSANDESLDILCISPTSRKRAMWARTIAAALPSLVVAWLGAIAVGVLGAVGLALATGLGASFLALCHAWLGGCTTIRHTAEDRAANRPVRSTWQMLVAMVVSGLGAGAIGSRAMGAPLFVALPLGALALLGGSLMFTARPRPIWAE